MKTNRISLLERLLLSVLAAAFLVIVGTGCNTAHGFGKDIESAGEGIQNGTK